jgi:Holliday junction resolvase RusA-like endonuclease
MFLCKYHRAWLKSAVEQLRWQWADAPIPKTMHVSAKIVSYLGTKRMIDASNLYQGPEDAMQLAGVLEDDVCIEDHDGSSRRYDKLNPRVEITLTVEVSVP